MLVPIFFLRILSFETLRSRLPLSSPSIVVGAGLRSLNLTNVSLSASIGERRPLPGVCGGRISEGLEIQGVCGR